VVTNAQAMVIAKATSTCTTKKAAKQRAAAQACPPLGPNTQANGSNVCRVLTDSTRYTRLTD